MCYYSFKIWKNKDGRVAVVDIKRYISSPSEETQKYFKNLGYKNGRSFLLSFITFVLMRVYKEELKIYPWL